MGRNMEEKEASERLGDRDQELREEDQWSL